MDDKKIKDDKCVFFCVSLTESKLNPHKTKHILSLYKEQNSSQMIFFLQGS